MRMPLYRCNYAVVFGLMLLQCGCTSSRPMAADRFEIAGDVQQPKRWSAAEFRAAFESDLQEATATSKGREIHFRGVPLLKVIERAEPKANLDRKNAALALAVVVEARDRYAAAFSLCELRDEYGHAPAFVAVEIDRRPLEADRGPVELIVPNDRKSSRWVHSVARIHVVDLTREN